VGLDFSPFCCNVVDGRVHILFTHYQQMFLRLTTASE
jgi:hypothetical protein